MKKENIYFLLFIFIYLGFIWRKPIFLEIKLPKTGLKGVFQTHP